MVFNIATKQIRKFRQSPFPPFVDLPVNRLNVVDRRKSQLVGFPVRQSTGADVTVIVRWSLGWSDTKPTLAHLIRPRGYIEGESPSLLHGPPAFPHACWR